MLQCSREDRHELAKNLDDPLNRYYRYPLARKLLGVLGGLPLRPDHVTYLHTLVGLTAAVLVARGGRFQLVIAFVLLETRMILDCYDGVLAREKNLSSPRGRTIDELGDAVSYIALCVAMAVHLRQSMPLAGVIALHVALLSIGAITAHSYDFYKRRLGSALKDGRDAIGEEVEQKESLLRNGKGTVVTRFGLWFDRWQIRLYEPRYPTGGAVETVVARAPTPAMRILLKMVGLLSWDNALAVLHVGVLFGAVLYAEVLAIACGIAMFVATAFAFHVVLGADTETRNLERRP
ncbi:MAG: CDP-alcohol phosphatidyltransferase family protein [Polyangiales bacterium]